MAHIRVIQDILQERLHQDAKWGEQNHPDHGPGDTSPIALVGFMDLPTAKSARELCERSAEDGSISWGNILIEEVCEAIEASADPCQLRAELVQVAAVTIAWLECIDRREAHKVSTIEGTGSNGRAGSDELYSDGASHE